MTTLDPVDAALASALGVHGGADGDHVVRDDLLDVDALAVAADTPVAVIEAIEREGLLVPLATDPPRFAPSDVETIRAAMAMLQTGLPLGEFLDLARHADEVLRDLADRAVETFLLYVRDPVRGTNDDTDTAAAELVEAFDRMLPAVRGLVGGHFEALLLAGARTRLAEALVAAEAPIPTADSARTPDTR